MFARNSYTYTDFQHARARFPDRTVRVTGAPREFKLNREAQWRCCSVAVGV